MSRDLNSFMTHFVNMDDKTMRESVKLQAKWWRLLTSPERVSHRLNQHLMYKGRITDKDIERELDLEFKPQIDHEAKKKYENCLKELKK